MFKPLRAMSVLRLYAACSGVILASAMIRLLDRPEHEGYQMGFALALFSGLALADVIINDFMPEDVVFKQAARWRNVGFMVLGILYASSVFFLLQYRDPPSLLVGRMVLDSFACAFVSFAGIGEVYEESQSKPPRLRKPTA